MAKDPKKVLEGLGMALSMISNEDVQKTIFGTYSDGKPRSFFDAMSGEVLSPKQKQKKLYKKRKSGKKKIRL